MEISKLSRKKWIKEASANLQAEPFKWKKKDADWYAGELATSYYDEEYEDPGSAVLEDASYWD